MKVAIDVDGVCLNWFENLCKHFNRECIAYDWNIDWIEKHWFDIETDEKFWKDLPLLGIPKIDFSVYLTAMPKRWLRVRKDNLDKYGFPDKPIVVEEDKIEWCLANKFDIIVDDKPSTIKSAREAGLKAIQVYPHYAKFEIEDGPWVRNVEEITDNMLDIGYYMWSN